MPRVAVVTPHFTQHDAVCNDVLGMYEALRKRGSDARIYAADWTVGETKLKVWPVSRIKEFLKNPRDVLIYHHSMGWETGCDLLAELSCRRIIKYHNVTPPEFFVGWGEEYENVCRAGRSQTNFIANAQCDLYLADSKHNLSELISAGAPESRSVVVHPFHRIEHLFHLGPDFEIIDRYRDGKASMLMVGSLFPNKGHAFLLEVFATYYHDYNKNSRLFIAGKEGESLRKYSNYLHEQAEHLQLGADVVFTGQVTDDELKAYYLMADLFVTASEHEGFCVPLVESMALKLPIVALGSAAIPDTVGDVGLIWGEKDPYLFAESIDTLINDESIRSRMGLMGRRRYDNLFTNDKTEEQFLNALGEVL